MNFNDDRWLGLLVLAAIALAAAFMLASCERKHEGDTIIVDDGSSVSIYKDNENANNDVNQNK